ncbi:hypothetical protein WA577_003336 [Blastocystis sp. JDR]
MQQCAIRLLFVISNINDLYFCPLLPYLVILLLHHVSEEEVYVIITSILDRGDLRRKYFIINQRFYEAFIEHLPSLNQRFANAENLQFSSLHPSLYGYLFRSWISSLLFLSIKSCLFNRVVDAFLDVGIWLFPSLYIAYLNRYGATLLRGELGPNEEENAKQIESLLYGLDEEEWETLLLESVSLSGLMTTEEVAVLEEMEAMQKRIDEGEYIMNICKYHLYYVIGPSRLLTPQLCKEVMSQLPVRVQSQDPRLVYTSLIHGYHVVHLLECAEAKKPTLLLMQVEYNGHYIGLYREDRWSRRGDAHGQSDSLLLYISFHTRKGKTSAVVRKWSGKASDQYIDGVEKPTQYVYVRSPERYIMIGAGGKKGISVYTSEDYTKAYSQQSDVYLNPPLCDREFFSISSVELFDFVSPG